MDNQSKQNGVSHTDTELHEDYLDGEVPWSCSVGRGDKDSYRNHAKGEHADMYVKVTGEWECVERQIEMEEIADPNGDRVYIIYVRMFELSDGRKSL